SRPRPRRQDSFRRQNLSGRRTTPSGPARGVEALPRRTASRRSRWPSETPPSWSAIWALAASSAGPTLLELHNKYPASRRARVESGGRVGVDGEGGDREMRQPVEHRTSTEALTQRPPQGSFVPTREYP